MENTSLNSMMDSGKVEEEEFEKFTFSSNGAKSRTEKSEDSSFFSADFLQMNPLLEGTTISPLVYLLPEEIWQNRICVYLSKRDISLLRLTCRWFRFEILRFPLWRQWLPLHESQSYIKICKRLKLSYDIYGVFTQSLGISALEIPTGGKFLDISNETALSDSQISQLLKVPTSYETLIISSTLANTKSIEDLKKRFTLIRKE